MAWFSIAELYENINIDNNINLAKNAISRFLENVPKDEKRQETWKKWAKYASYEKNLDEELYVWCKYLEEIRDFLTEVSNAANEINRILKSHSYLLEVQQKRIMLENVISIFEKHAKDANGTDLSRLAWLFLNAKDSKKAREYTDLGLEKDPDNDYLIKLDERLLSNW